MSAEPLVGIVAHPRTPAWPAAPHPRREGELLTPGRAYRVPLSVALERRWTADAHAMAYAHPSGRRLRAPALQTTEVRLTSFWLDVDCPDVHGSKRPAPTEWLERQRQRFAEHARRTGSAPAVYATRGGVRAVYSMTADPFTVRNDRDAKEWRRLYSTAVCWLERVSGIRADIACGDWQRLYRLPNVVRDGESRAPAFIDLVAPGQWVMDVEPCDIEAARQRAPRAFGVAKVRDVTPCASSGFGLFYHLLQLDGAILHPRGNGCYVVRCPNEREHTSGVSGDGSTLLYLPHAGSEVGCIACLHSHCQSKRGADWLRHWSHDERDRARDVGGISSRVRRGCVS